MADLQILPTGQANEQITGTFVNNLNNILNMKAEGMQQVQSAKAIQSLLPGIDPHSAYALASNPMLLQHALPKAMEALQTQNKQKNITDILNFGNQGGQQQDMQQGKQAGQAGMGANESAIYQQYQQDQNKAFAMMNIDPMIGRTLLESAVATRDKALDRIQKAKEFEYRGREADIKHQEVDINRSIKQQEFDTKQHALEQAKTVTANNKVMTPFNNRVDPSDEMLKYIEEARFNLQKPDASPGPLMGLTPEWGKNLWSTTNRDLDRTLTNILNGRIKLETSGVVNQFRAKKLDTAKANISNTKQSINNFLDELEEDVLPYVIKGKIRDRILLENDNEQPKNFMSVINREFEKDAPIYFALRKVNPEEMEEGTEFEIPLTGKFRVDSNERLGLKLLKRGKKYAIKY